MANIFPRGSNLLPLKIVLCVVILVPAVSGAMWYYFTPKYTRVGYQPNQPIQFPHDIHVAQLGMDCRYCHSFVEVAAHSNVPTTQVCMNCHAQIQKRTRNSRRSASRGRAASRSNGCRSTRRPITFISITRRM